MAPKRSSGWGQVHWPPGKENCDIETGPNSIRLPALCVLCGKRGGGKSSSFYFLMRQLKADNLCDRVFILSPTADSPANLPYWKDLEVEENDIHSVLDNSSLQKIRESVEEEGSTWLRESQDVKDYQRLLKLLKGRKKIDTIDAQLLLTAQDRGWFGDDAVPPTTRYNHKPRLHAFLDDCQGSRVMVPSSQSSLGSLSIRHRHVGGCGVSLYVAVQNYTSNQGVPRYLRTNCTVLVLFKILDEKARQQVADEVSGDVPREIFLQKWEEATEQPYTPLVVEFGAKRHLFRAGWDRPLPCEYDPKP